MLTYPTELQGNVLRVAVVAVETHQLEILHRRLRHTTLPQRWKEIVTDRSLLLLIDTTMIKYLEVEHVAPVRLVPLGGFVLQIKEFAATAAVPVTAVAH